MLETDVCMLTRVDWSLWWVWQSPQVCCGHYSYISLVSLYYIHNVCFICTDLIPPPNRESLSLRLLIFEETLFDLSERFTEYKSHLYEKQVEETNGKLNVLWNLFEKRLHITNYSSAPQVWFFTSDLDTLDKQLAAAERSIQDLKELGKAQLWLPVNCN